MSWHHLSSLLPPPKTLPPTPGDSSVLLSTHFISTLKSNLLSKSLSPSPSPSSPSVPDSFLASEIVKNLCLHFQTLLSNQSLLLRTVRGHEKGTFIPASPTATKALAHFLSQLQLSRHPVSELADWISRFQVEAAVLDAGVQEAQHAILEIKQALNTLVLAREQAVLALEDATHQQQNNHH